MVDEPGASAAHRLTLRVYYEDTDFSGVVYHANYLRFMERARTEWLRTFGIDQRGALAADPPLGFVVRRVTIDYLRPAHMDDLLNVETTAIAARGAVLTLRQRVLRGAEVLVDAQVAVVSLGGGRPVRLPAALRAALPPASPGEGR